MNVAIIGAGLSGLCCAITLEKHGINPIIFENRSMVGDRFVNGEALFNVLNRPINNCLSYIESKYEITLKATNEIKEIIMHSKNEVGSIKGNLGYINIRGRHENSFENQLVKQVNSKIIFNSKYTYEDIKKDFSHVILATGDGAYAQKLNNYRCDVTYALKGATIEGNFHPNTTHAWFNSTFVPKGYAYLIPFSNVEANIVMAYPDFVDPKEKERDYRWKEFCAEVEKDIGQSFKITDNFQIVNYISGICEKPIINNTYYVGNCFGAIAPALGFGQFVAILTGIYAALDILGIDNYEILTEPLFKNYKNSLVIRRALEGTNDNTFDFIIKNLDNKLFDGLIDKLHGNETDFDLVKWLSYAIHPIVNLKDLHN